MSNEEFYELFKKLSPENQVKVLLKYYELLEKQESGEQN